jgi:general secretion pathway protein D
MWAREAAGKLLRGTVGETGLARHAQLMLQARSVLQTGLMALFLGACSLAPEQLNLPGSLLASSPEKQQLANSNGRPGVPLSDQADPQTRTPRVYEGSGEYTGNVNGEAAPNGGAKARVDGNGVTLNLVGASVPEVAKTVLGDILRVNYSVSDKVKASITLSTAQPVPKDELLKIFESILRSEGIAISVENGVYHIVPADAAVATGKWAPSRGRQQIGSGSTVIPLRYVAAVEMERVLKSVAPQTQILRVDSARNLLIVSGTANELASIRTTVDAFDLDWMQGMSFALLPIESGDPEAIAKELDTVFANDKDSPSKGIVRFVPNNRLKSVLVISSRPEYLRKAEGWLRRIDLAGQATEKQVNVYHVQNRPAAELAVLLRRVYGSQQRERASTEAATQPQGGSSVLSSGDGQTSSDGLTPAPQTPSLGLSGASSAQGTGRRSAQAQQTDETAAEPSAGEQAQTDSRERAGDRGSGISIVADEPNNALIITATTREYKRMRQILSRIDIAGNQVLIEATIAEVTLNDNLKFGLKWFFEKGSSTGTFNASTASATIGQVLPTFGGFSYFLNTPNVKVALDALNSVTTVNLVSSPTLMVLDNKKAVLQIGDEVPVPTQQAQSTITPNAPIINSISYRNTGVILGITPRVGDNGRIQLDIEQEVSDVKSTAAVSTDNSQGVPAPTIAQRRVKTAVAVGDGEAIMLGGLMRDQTTVDHTKVPVVGDIPVVGNLFKSKSDNIARTELFIAITPHVVKDPRQIRSIADEFRDRLNLTTRPQRSGPPDKRENVDRTFVR